MSPSSLRQSTRFAHDATTLKRVSTGRDEDALRWDGDDDPTAVATPEALALPDGFTAVGKGADEVGRIDDDGTVVMPGHRKPLSSAMLVTLGIIGGIFALYVIGWVIGGLRLQGNRDYLLSDIMFQGSLWLAVLAPLIWFGTVFLLTMRSAAWVRIAWLVAGLVLLVPWPFIMMGAVGQ